MGSYQQQTTEGSITNALSYSSNFTDSTTLFATLFAQSRPMFPFSAFRDDWPPTSFFGSQCTAPYSDDEDYYRSGGRVTRWGCASSPAEYACPWLIAGTGKLSMIMCCGDKRCVTRVGLSPPTETRLADGPFVPACPLQATEDEAGPQTANKDIH